MLQYQFPIINVTLDHKTSQPCQFFDIEIYKSYIWKQNTQISFPLMYGLLGSDNIWPRYNYVQIWNLRVQKKKHIEKIAF